FLHSSNLFTQNPSRRQFPHNPHRGGKRAVLQRPTSASYKRPHDWTVDNKDRSSIPVRYPYPTVAYVNPSISLRSSSKIDSRSELLLGDNIAAGQGLQSPKNKMKK
ncbi:hypothetical protein LINPERPRIM_LOCUS39846, partial [Linum perenne]